MQAGGHDYPCVAGDCFLLRMNEPCHGWHHPNQPLTVVWIVFRGLPKLIFRHGAGTVPPIHRRLSALPLFTELLERAIRAYHSDAITRGRGQDWLDAALAVLAEEDEKPRDNGPAAEQHQKILELCERIRRAPGQPFSVAELAAHAHYSPDHFARLFHHFTGESPRRFITRTRIEAACALLTMSSQTASEIAATLGFVDMAHFSREFKRHIGVSPRTYRHQSTPNFDRKKSF